MTDDVLDQEWGLNQNTEAAPLPDEIPVDDVSPKTATEAEGPRELTFGEKAVWLTFNPGNNPEVEGVKKSIAVLIDFCNKKRTYSPNTDQGRMFSEWITNLQTAQMWIVKAITRIF